MNWDEVKELGPFYALGTLDKETALAVEEFLRRATPEQKREFWEWREVAANIPFSLSSPPVPEHLKGQLLARIAKEPQPVVAVREVARPQAAAPRTIDQSQGEQSGKVLTYTSARPPKPSTESTATRWLLMAATVLLTLAGGYLLWQNLRLSNERDRLAQELKTSEENFNKVVSPATKVIAMAGEEAPQASAKVVWDTKQQTWVIYIFNLPEPPTDKDYQLWFVTKDSNKLSAAVFRPDNGGQKVLRLILPPEVAATGLAATAVTLEPKGGSLQPTSGFYLKGGI